LIIAPGFIDVHTHIEGDEVKEPTADNFIYNGVTTVITGNCGSSNVDIKKYLIFWTAEALVNVGTFIGHNNVRKAVLGEAAIAPDSIQLKKMEALLNRQCSTGQWGFQQG